MADDLAANTVFLGGEGEGNEGDTVEVSEVAGDGADADVPNEELGVAKAEGVAFAGATVFAGSEQPEVSNVA